MSKNRLFVLIIFIILVLSDLCLIWQNSLCKKALLYYRRESGVSGYSQNAHAIMTINDSFLNNGLGVEGITITDVNENKSLLFQDLFEGDDSKTHFLVCRFSEYDCEQCVDYAIQKASESVKKLSLNMEIILLGNYENNHALKAYCSNISKTVTASVYNFPGRLFPIDENGNPYYFVTDNSLKVYDVFSPDKMDVAMTDTYFELLSQKVGNGR